jgi:hypothetical protein
MTLKQILKNPLLSTISVFSSLFGFSGIEHGFFEILQGNSKPENFIISAIGPLQRYWIHGKETAFTVIPNFQLTGIVAIVFSTCVIIWSIFFLRNRYSWIVLLFFSIAQFITGGGFAQIFLSVVLSIAAIGLYRPRKLWKKYVSEKIRRTLSFIWIYLFLVFIIIFILSIELAIFGFPLGAINPELTYKIMMNMSYLMIVIFCLTLITAYAKESILNIEENRYSH